MLKAVTDGRGADVVIEAIGQPGILGTGYATGRKGGTINFFGGCPVRHQGGLGYRSFTIPKSPAKQVFTIRLRTSAVRLNFCARQGECQFPGESRRAAESASAGSVRFGHRRNGQIKTAIIPGTGNKTVAVAHLQPKEYVRNYPPRCRRGYSQSRSPGIYPLARHPPLRKLSTSSVLFCLKSCIRISTTSIASAAGRTILGDEIGDPQESLRLLAWWRASLKPMYRGEAAHPVFVALKDTVRGMLFPWSRLIA